MPGQSLVDRERAFHDARYADDQRAAIGGFYAVTVLSSAPELYRRSVPESPGGHVLELGCGPGSTGWTLARQGFRLQGIDISGAAVDDAERYARDNEVANASFSVMDAHRLDVADGSVDVVTGAGILHHLDLARAVPEIARVLRPGGKAVFYEPMAHNPLLRCFRRFTPSMRTADEHPLTADDIDRLFAHFDVVEPMHFHLFSFVAAPLASAPLGGRLLRGLERLDRAILRFAPVLRRYGWIVVIELREPKTR